MARYAITGGAGFIGSNAFGYGPKVGLHEGLVEYVAWAKPIVGDP